jgi:hypothetical protein
MSWRRHVAVKKVAKEGEKNAVCSSLLRPVLMALVASVKDGV